MQDFCRDTTLGYFQAFKKIFTVSGQFFLVLDTVTFVCHLNNSPKPHRWPLLMSGVGDGAMMTAPQW